MNAPPKFTWEHALTVALLIACIALLVGVLHGGPDKTTAVPIATGPALVVGTTRPVIADLEEDFQADQALLSRQIPLSVFHSGQTLNEALRAAAEAAHCPLRIEWKSIEAAGPDGDTPDTSAWPAPASADHVPLRTALRWILSEINRLNDILDFTIDNGTIVVSTADESAKQTIAVVYNVRDLIDAGSPGVPGPTRQEIIDQICALIKDTVSRESWTENGGTVGSMREMMGLLIVTQTRANHLELFELLSTLRRTSRMRPELVSTADPVAVKPTSNSIPPELERRIATLRFDEDQVTCEHAINELASAAGISIRVDWRSFLPLEIARSTVIDPSPLSNVSIAEAIRAILVPDEDIKSLSFSVHGGMIAVAFDRTTEVYNVRDLEGSPVSSTWVGPNGSELDGFVGLLTSNIDPTSWDVAGSAIGHVQHLGSGLLVVTQTRAAQMQVVELLRKLRQAKVAKPL